MLHSISWFTYGSAVIFIAIAYYGYVGLTFYRSELQAAIYRLTGKKPAVRQFAGGDFQLTDYPVTGTIKPEGIDFVAQEELSFGPADENESSVIPHPSATIGSISTDTHLLGDFSEMISEVKTLIRVINESSESKENFEMLFRLIVQKYTSLTGSVYENQINEYLINEGAAEFPFPLTLTELQSYWNNDNNK
ncbi:hypothetical protein KXD93_06500 [Mucilaginibacter sp. BJC16-A38]|uniref:hypothetical protein n=1 Tax=Mucilaginibacter phenanthrenivorans TaxID=1234842 RepID=UPI002157CEB1|nr:hypothetical protein [Mucilaginibacter phenanthrenivorans]MCR8557282.1 hypothetical protein [Mucilaginibacter phenanthrenivorans]